MGLSEYPADHRSHEDHRGCEEQSGDNPSYQRTATPSNLPTRLAARIEFGGSQFLLRALMGHGQVTTPTPAAGSRKGARRDTSSLLSSGPPS
jgi:hypothetical protein